MEVNRDVEIGELQVPLNKPTTLLPWLRVRSPCKKCRISRNSPLEVQVRVIDTTVGRGHEVFIVLPPFSTPTAVDNALFHESDPEQGAMHPFCLIKRSGKGGSLTGMKELTTSKDPNCMLEERTMYPAVARPHFLAK